MDAFGDDYVVHNLPLLLICGLGEASKVEKDISRHAGPSFQQDGFRISVDLPEVQGRSAELALSALDSYDGSEAPWKAQTSGGRGLRLFRTKRVGRVFSLPPRKAPPPPQAPRFLSGNDADGNPSPLVLHSPLSPLTPSSPLYPDGVMSRLWVAKHQYHLPSVLLVFSTLTADSNTASLSDNKTKTAINALRAALAATHYKTRLAVVLLGDGPIDASDIEDRLGLIRKATTLDLKSLYFCPFNSSEVEVNVFMSSLLSSVYANSIEYYRDLSKHARRKRNRGSVPQPTIPSPDSPGLSFQGWNARYEFKLGVFAEFRQEMEAACRNYEQSYELLFSPEVLDSRSVWDARFNEARLLADVIAIRIIRCFLWSSHSTSAVRAWCSHRSRLRELLDRRGRGTENYEWEAWQSLWAKTMAELITRAEVPALNMRAPGSSTDLISVFVGPEKSSAVGERWTPWECLAHEGYWLDIARKHTSARRRRAMELSEDQRRNPTDILGQSRISSGSYICPAPHEEVPVGGTGGFNYTASIAADLDAAIRHFEKRGQVRKIQILLLRKALEFYRSSEWSEAAKILETLWKSRLWRETGWWKLLQSVGLTLLECAQRMNETRLLAPLLWELGNGCFDLTHDVEGLSLEHVVDLIDEEKMSISMDANLYVSRVAPSFAFARSSCPVGEIVECQLALRCATHVGHEAVGLKGVKIVFEGGLKPVYIRHDHNLSNDRAIEGNIDVVDVTLQEGDDHRAASLIALANLVVGPGQTRVFNMSITPREAGEMSVGTITLMVEEEEGEEEEEEKYSLTTTFSNLNENDEAMINNEWFELKKGGRPVSRAVGPERDVRRLEVLPRAARVEINALNFKETYYANEEILIDLEIINKEDETAKISIEARLISPVPGGAKISWFDDNKNKNKNNSTTTEQHDGLMQQLAGKDLGIVGSTGKATASIAMTEAVAALDYELEVTVSYKLLSDSAELVDLVLQKVVALDVVVTRPFEANYDFQPKLLTEPWPNFFEMSAETTLSPSLSSSTTLPPQGLRHLYQVTASLYSFATEPIIIEAVLLTATTVSGMAVTSSSMGVVRHANSSSSASSTADDQISTIINPEQTRQFDLDLSVQKLVLGDRSIVSLGLWLEIGWRRLSKNSNSPSDRTRVNTTMLEVPPLQISMAEPRVLLTVERQLPPPHHESSQGNYHDKDEDEEEGDEDEDEQDEEEVEYRLTYTIENPSMHLLTFNITMDSSGGEDFAFSGARAVVVSLTPISRHTVHYVLVPKRRRHMPDPNSENGGVREGEIQEGVGKWVKVKLNVVDAYFNQTLRVLPANGHGHGGSKELVRRDKKTGDVYVWFD